MGSETEMNVLVTGGCGYLGSVLVDRLLDEGHDVTVFDNMLFGNVGSQADMITGDITDAHRLEKALQDRDAVVHLASIVGEGACNLEKETAAKVNYVATRNLVILCKERRVKLLYPSTASVYGVSKSSTTCDEAGETSPLSIYAITKLAAEDCIKALCDDHVIFRLGTLHGLSKRMRFDLVVNRFIAMAAAREEIMVFGGSQHRPFLHVKDACEFFKRALEADRQGLFNLSGTNHKVIDVAHVISGKLGGRVLVMPELRDPRDYQIDSSLAIRTFNATFDRTIEDSTEEIVPFVASKDYKDPRFNNEEWLRLKWSH